MTPQERQMLSELFDRLAALESAPRDAEALGAINEGLRRAPNALYPLVQTVLVQDEALKRANAHIRELEDELGIEQTPTPPQGGFLDNMRSTMLGREQQGAGTGSVPSVRPGIAPPAPSKWGSGTTLRQTGYAPEQQQPGFAQEQPQQPQGGSFLGSAASTAMGVMGGAMLMQGMRGLFGGQHGGGGQGHGFGSGGQGGSPSAPGSAGGGELARDAGAGDIGRSGGETRGGEGGQRAGLFDTAQNDDYNDGDADGDFNDDADFGDDSDTA
jgi:hypothetical protein